MEEVRCLSCKFLLIKEWQIGSETLESTDCTRLGDYEKEYITRCIHVFLLGNLLGDCLGYEMR